LELSRRLTIYEDEAFQRDVHGMHVVGRELTVLDTTLENVAARASELAEVVHRVEEEGRRLAEETEVRSRAYSARVRERAAELADLASHIRFPG
jgi:septation ring formation regulator EzrA